MEIGQDYFPPSFPNQLCASSYFILIGPIQRLRLACLPLCMLIVHASMQLSIKTENIRSLNYVWAGITSFNIPGKMST
jgi:hypothetical protein